MESTNNETAERGKKGNAYEVEKIDPVSVDVHIATLRHVHTHQLHFAVQAIFTGCVYFRTNDADNAVRMATRLARTFDAADHAGSAQHADYWQPACEAGPVRSLGAVAALDIARAFGWTGRAEIGGPTQITIRDIDRDRTPKVFGEYCRAVRSPHSTHTGTR